MARVLIVDDDPRIAMMVAERLRALGIDTDTASNGRDALLCMCAATTQGRPYDMAIVDIVMPGIDGWQVLKAIKHNPLWSSTSVIVVSGYASSTEDLLRIIEFDGVYVEKRAGFLETVGEIAQRVIADSDARRQREMD